LSVLGFSYPDFHGAVIEEFERLRESDTVRVIDALAVYKGAGGGIEALHLSNLPKDEAVELGSKIAALIGLGIAGEAGMEAGAEVGAEKAAAEDIHVFSDEEAWDVVAEIPDDSAAALILLEHHWAVPLGDATARAGGFRISDGFIRPLDLIEIGRDNGRVVELAYEDKAPYAFTGTVTNVAFDLKPKPTMHEDEQALHAHHSQQTVTAGIQG
jgi:uncharacterized membrane protein